MAAPLVDFGRHHVASYGAVGKSAGLQLTIWETAEMVRSGREGGFMAEVVSPTRGYIVAAGLGALAGGLLVAVTARVLPRVMSRAMAGMMREMMGRVGEGEEHLPDT